MSAFLLYTSHIASFIFKIHEIFTSVLMTHLNNICIILINYIFSSDINL